MVRFADALDIYGRAAARRYPQPELVDEVRSRLEMHNAEVLGQLCGVDAEELAQLKEDNIV